MPTQTARPTLLSHRTRTTSLLRPTDLNSLDFAPFGDVVENPAARGGESVKGLRSVDANQGSARKWIDVTTMTNFYEECASRKEGRSVVNLFVCQPRELVKGEGGKLVFPVKVLERHPFTPQMFVPMGVNPDETNVRYLVIVAPTLSVTNDDTSTTTSTSHDQSSGSARKGPGPPDLDNIKAFIAKGDQAVTYGAGTWHAPMVVVGTKSIDFVVVQYSNGVASEDCQEVEIDGDLAVDVGEAGVAKAKL